MTKKEAIVFCKKMQGKSTVKALLSIVTACFAIGNVYKHAYNMGVYETGKRDIESTAGEDDAIELSINGKEV